MKKREFNSSQFYKKQKWGMYEKLLFGIKSSLIGFLVAIISVNIINYKNENLKTETIKTNDLISIYLENEEGEYILSEENNFPTEGYVLNKEKTYCVNNSYIDYDYIDNEIDVKTNGSDNCYVYFSEGNIAKQILHDNGGVEYINSKTAVWGAPITTNEGMFKTEDEYGDSYYFRGAVDNNWIVFGKDANQNDMYWRIVRINGDGSVRIVYTGITPPTEEEKVVMKGDKTFIGKSPFNATYNRAEYVGYMYTLGERHGTGTSSTIKNYLETWYSNNLMEEDDQIADAYFCYDRTAATSGLQDADWGSAGGDYTGTGTGTAGTTFAALGRLSADSTAHTASNREPSLMCPNMNDQYTKDDLVDGNGLLNQKIGLINMDEAVLAGGAAGEATSDYNSAYYLYREQYYFLGSPFGFNTASMRASMARVHPTGDVRAAYVDDLWGSAVAVSLSPIITVEGLGTWNEPYRVV